MALKISVDGLSEALSAALEEESVSIRRTTEQALADTAADLRKLLTARSPQDTSAYRKGWRRRSVLRDGKRCWLVYNTAKPWLTWPLEYGTRSEEGRGLIQRLTEEENAKLLARLLAELGRS